jgi:hypothetical protein
MLKQRVITEFATQKIADKSETFHKNIKKQDFDANSE